MTRSMGLVLGLAAILLGAVALERMLVAGAEHEVLTSAPPPPAPPPPAPPLAPRALPASQPTPGPLAGSLIPPPPGGAAVGQAPVEVEAAEPLNPFTADDAREIEYAFQLVVGPSSTVETAKNAAEVFERCLKQFPTNARCHQGLVAAQQRQHLPNWRPPGAPSPLADGVAPAGPRPFPRPSYGARRLAPPAAPAPTE